jgi:NAD(P)-dependent dehydrogenase (short-subunit alcohol dehydrogenase family)
VNAAIVTGAAGAIGRAVAEELSAQDRPVVLVDRSEAVEAVRDDLRSCGAKVELCVVDLADADAPAAILAAADRLGGPSVLVNNAGITRDARADAMDVDDFRLVVRVNLVAPLRLAEAVADQLPDGGTIVNVSSRAALGNFGQANYVAAKSALIGATRALAVRLAPRVRVNAVAPGLVDTPMTQAMPAHVLDKLVDRVPAGRAADPREIAAVVGFLCAPASAYVTGQVLLACGGRSIAG